MCPTKATTLAGEQPDYAIGDLFNAIARKEYPSWTLYVQVRTVRLKSRDLQTRVLGGHARTSEEFTLQSVRFDQDILSEDLSSASSRTRDVE